MSHNTTLPVPRIVALHLAQIGTALPGFGNGQRDRLRAIAEALKAGADVASAHMEALQGVADGVGPTFTDDRPETWLLCAVAAVLGGGERPGALVLPPPDDALAHWRDVLGVMVGELTAHAPPELDAAQRAMRGLTLQSLGLWLGAVQLIQARAALGESVPNDPDALPLPGIDATQH